MAKESYIGLVVGRDQCDWAVLQRGREGFERVAGGHEDVSAAPAAPGVAPDAVEAHPALARLKALAPRLKGRLTLGLASEHVLLRVMRLPAVDPADIQGMVAFQAEKLSPFPIDNMVVSHEILRLDQDASLVLLAAVRVDVVERLGDLLKQAGLAAQRVDAAVLGWWRTLQDAGQLAATGFQIDVRLTAPSPQLIVVKDGLPIVFRSLSGVSTAPEDVAELAREIGFTLVSLELEQGHLASPTVTIWADAEPDAAWMAAVAGASGAPLRHRLLSDLPGECEGMARRAADEGRVDLTPASWIQARTAKAFRRRLIRSAAGIVGAWLLAVGLGFGMLALERQRLERIRTERESLRGQARAVRDTRRRVFMVKQYLDNTSSALECLRVISTLLPPGIELTSFAYHKGEDVKLSGEAPAVAAVYEFKSNLDAAPLFPEATLQGPRQSPNGRQMFDVSLRLKGDES
ncbi:MAG: PilN domain-containing protein [Lentisphaerae bacterium]|nr:PilN domain-containing protein [Lentisphaerota bacterium]